MCQIQVKKVCIKVFRKVLFHEYFESNFANYRFIMMTRTVGSIIVQVDKGENERWRGADLPYYM